MADTKDDTKRPIFVIKKIKKGGGHHGGAWKVAYADFVTAMMAFFLLLWLLNATTEEQKSGISNYFDPNPQISTSESGAGGMLGGLSMSTQGARSTDLSNPMANPILAKPTPSNKMGEPDLERLEQEKLEAEVTRREEEEFQKVKEQIEAAMNASEELKEMLKNLVVDMTPEGLRIQIVDQDGAATFASGSAQMFDKTKKLMQTVAGVIKTLPNQVSVRGHTDGAQYAGANPDYSNWELSADRANASRIALMSGGIPIERVANVVGKADTDHFIKDQPLDPRNRRISIILLHDKQTRTDGPNASTGKSSVGPAAPAAPADPGYTPTPGAVTFP